MQLRAGLVIIARPEKVAKLPFGLGETVLGNEIIAAELLDSPPLLAVLP